MKRTFGFDVEPASDEALRTLSQACDDYLADISRGGVGPDPRNEYQASLLRLLGENMPAVLSRLQVAEGVGKPVGVA